MADLGARYATALFQIASEKGQLDVVLGESRFLRDTFKGEEGALRILTHPLISTQEKNAFIEKVYSPAISTDLLGFMKLAVAKNREAFLLPTVTKLIDMIKRHQNHTTARVVSAVPLDETQLTRISSILGKKLGKKVGITAIVDPSQIAGISVHIDGYFLDRTVKSMLKNMKDYLSKAE